MDTLLESLTPLPSSLQASHKLLTLSTLLRTHKLELPQANSQHLADILAPYLEDLSLPEIPLITLHILAALRPIPQLEAAIIVPHLPRKPACKLLLSTRDPIKNIVDALTNPQWRTRKNALKAAPYLWKYTNSKEIVKQAVARLRDISDVVVQEAAACLAANFDDRIVMEAIEHEPKLAMLYNQAMHKHATETTVIENMCIDRPETIEQPSRSETPSRHTRKQQILSRQSDFPSMDFEEEGTRPPTRVNGVVRDAELSTVRPPSRSIHSGSSQSAFTRISHPVDEIDFASIVLNEEMGTAAKIPGGSKLAHSPPPTASVLLQEQPKIINKPRALSSLTQKRLDARRTQIAHSAPASTEEIKEPIAEPIVEPRVKTSTVKRARPKAGAPTPEAENIVSTVSTTPSSLPPSILKRIEIDPHGTFTKHWTVLKANGEWAEIQRSMEILTPLAHVSEAKAVLAELVPCVLTNIMNLRSTVSRIALALLYALISNQRIDPYVSDIVTMCVKKVGENIAWLTTEVERTIAKLTDCCSIPKMLGCFLNLTEQKNSAVRDHVSAWLALCVEKCDLQDIPKIDRLIQAALTLNEDGSNGTRVGARRIIRCLKQYPRIEKLCGTNLPKWKLALRRLENIHDDPVVEMVPTPPKTGAPKSGRKKSGGALVKKTSSTTLNEEITALYERLGQSDWNTRLEAVSTAIDYFESHSADFEDSIRMNQFLDIYLDRLRDGNGKVQTAALQGFSRVILAAPRSLDATQLTPIFPVLSVGISSSSINTRTLALDAFQSLASSCDPGCMVQAISGVLINNPATKARNTYIDSLSDLTPGLYTARSGIVLKYVVPCACKLFSGSANTSTTASQNEQINRLLKTLYSCIGKNFWTNATIKKLGPEEKRRLEAVVIG